MEQKRREFLKTIGALGAAAGVLSPAGTLHGAPEASEAERHKEGPITLNILQTTDVHCQVFPHDELFWEEGRAVFRKTGGYAHLASFFKRERKKHPYTLLVDTGDMFQGSELSVKTTGKAMLPLLNELGYDLYLPGNWDVIYYKKAMQSLMGGLNAPKVCANMYHDAGEGKKGELIFHPYYIWYVAGVKIGILGYTDPLVPLRQPPSLSKGIVYTKPEENLAHYVDVLRNDEGCAFVLMLAHLGLSQQIHLANLPQCKGVDYILGGDTHERVRKPIQGTYAKVVEPGAFGSFVGRLSLTIENGKVLKDEYVLEEMSTERHKADPEMDQLIRANEAPFSGDIHQVLGYSSIPLYRYFVIENPIDTLILDALKWRLPDIDLVLSNGFRFCPPRATPDHTGNIPITEGYIYDMLPTDSTVRIGKVSGKQLRDWLEKELHNVFAQDASKRFGGWVIKFKGMSMKFKAYAEYGSRVQEVLVNGQALDDLKTYSISACEREGDPEDVLCRMKNVAETQNTPYTLHGILRDYLAAHPLVRPIPPQNAVALDAPATLLTQVYGVDYQFH